MRNGGDRNWSANAGRGGDRTWSATGKGGGHNWNDDMRGTRKASNWHAPPGSDARRSSFPMMTPRQNSSGGRKPAFATGRRLASFSASSSAAAAWDSAPEWTERFALPDSVQFHFARLVEEAVAGGSTALQPLNSDGTALAVTKRGDAP